MEPVTVLLIVIGIYLTRFKRDSFSFMANNDENDDDDDDYYYWPTIRLYDTTNSDNNSHHRHHHDRHIYRAPFTTETDRQAEAHRHV